MRSQVSSVREHESVPGSQAEHPGQIPAEGWKQVVKRGWAEAKADQVPLLAAGVAFYSFLAIFPAVIALVLVYGLIADPATIAAQVNSLGGALPEEVRSLIVDQVSMSSGRQTGAGIGLVVAIAVALWSASGGVGNLMTAISTAYDEEETRGFVKKRAIALVLTLAAILFMVVVLALVAAAPALLNQLPVGARAVLQLARWVLLALLITVALAVLYRVAPDRDAPKFRWVSVGAGVATLLWLLASVGFSIYTSTFASYAKTYGALAGVVVLLFWLWITSYAILLGAEINAEAEQQTARDSTKGEEQPIGQRDAVKADSVPGADQNHASGSSGTSGKSDRDRR